MAGITIWQIWKRMGIAVFGFIGCILIFFVIMWGVASKIGFYKEKITAQTDSRCSDTEELVSAMKEKLKMNCSYCYLKIIQIIN